MTARFALILLAALPLFGAVPGIQLGDDRYEVSLLDSDKTAFFVSNAMDLSGRLFVGCREALFVYEPDGDGFAERQELFRFPKNSWLYDLEVYGDDLFVLCNTALYRIRGAVTKRDGLKPEKLLWGLPQGHYHQGMHGLEFGPTGDLFISMGDPQPHMHWDRSRPDHLWHWTFFVGPENREVPYTGVGAVFRYGIKDHSLSIHASGLRNPCGISFDPQWRLYANDNDQEGASASPGKLVYAPRHSWHGWVRGWAAQQHPTRRDILPVTNLELDVPVGQSWHEGAVLVANWGNRTVSRHRVTDHVAPRDVLLEGEGQRRPVSVTPLNDGRLVVSVCYMQGNEGSPVRQTDLLLLTPQNPSEPWALRYRQHQEQLRTGKFAEFDVYFAAMHGDAKVQALAAAGDESAIRAMAEFPAKFAKLEVGPLLAQPKLRHALLEYLHATDELPPIELAADADAFVRQSAAQLIGRLASAEQLAAWADDNSPLVREAAVNAAGFAIWQAIESTDKFPAHREMARSSQIAFEHPDGPVKLEKPVFIFMPSEWWKENRESMAIHAAILSKALADPVPEVRVPAAVQLFFLKDPAVDERVLAILAEAEIDLGAKSKASQNARAQKKALRALKNAALASGETIPAVFANQDWSSGGNAVTGKNLFTSRGCVACHLAPDDGKGGSIGPSLVDVHTRFSAQYLAESILLPNRFVSPNFHPTTLTMKDGTVHTGFIEKDGATVSLRIVTGTVMELPAAEIAKRATSHQSMMPAGLVQSPKEMRHLLAYMLKRDALSAWKTSGNWAVENGELVLTPRPGETGWTRYGDYLWSKKAYANFEVAFEYKHERGGNSGFYFNVTDRQKAVGSVIEVQIKDSHGSSKLDAHGISGGILPGVTPTANAAKPAGEWNQMTVKSLDGEVTVTLNGVLVNQVSLTHPKLKSKPKQGYFGFQDHGLPFWLRNITVRELTGSSTTGFDPLKPNVYRFAPQAARFVRVDLLPGSKRQPCIDEIEIFGPGSDTNLALAGKASASSLLKGYEWKHQIHFLNDGKYTNARSWIPAKPTGWAQIKLAKSAPLDRVVLSRDRGGQHKERVPFNFDIKLSADGKTWKTVTKVRKGKVFAAARKPAASAPVKASVPRGGGLPNIVLILADDFGWGDASCNSPNSPLKTPAIDRIANEGIRLTNAHTPSAVCTPTRYGLLTGRYPWRSYLKKEVLAYYAPAMITKDQTTIASYLKSQGYRTAGFGKWHLGLDWTPVEGDPENWRSHWQTRDFGKAVQVQKGIDHTRPFKNGPVDIGFDSYFGTPSNCTRLPFFIQDDRVFGQPKPDKKGQLRAPGCVRDTVDDIYVGKAIGFIEEHRAKHAASPFFVYLPLNAIHGAVSVPQRFTGKSGIARREDKILWANESVGKVLEALDRMRLSDDTLVIFTTDNGPINSPVARKAGHQPAGPYRGLKTNVWDGGTRVPFLARWPGRIPAGAVTNRLARLTDVLATVAALCGTPLPDGAGADSVNLLPTLLQKESKVTDRPALVTASYAGFLTIREGKWKAVFGTKWTGGHPGNNYGGPLPKGFAPDDPGIGQLYDISTDPFETSDLWERHPEVVEKLRRQLQVIKQKEKTDAEASRNAVEWNTLFNGEDIEGWAAKGGEAAFKVEDGCIVGTTKPNTPNTFLCPPKKYANFELTFDVLCDSALNSGVQIRSISDASEVPAGLSEADAIKAKKMADVNSLFGPQVEIAATGNAAGVWFEGVGGWLLAPKPDIANKVYRQDDWNHYRVLANGSRIQVWINGTRISDGKDTRSHFTKGRLGFQVHGIGNKPGPLSVRWKNIRIRELPATQNQAQPNVVLIFSDDMGYSDLPKFGESEIPTPNIDRLAKSGTLFTDAYVTAPICVASRMGLMSGQNQQRFGIYDNIYGEDRTRLFLNQTLVPAVFQKAGYRTAHVGKWHLSGNKRLQYDTAGPRERGFDESVAIRGGDSAFWKGTPVFRNGKQFPAPEYLTDLWGTEACAFIDRAHDQPFFLYLAYNAVHSPMHALESDRAKFSTVADENRRTYDGMLLAMDRSIGRVLDRLDKHGIADNTIVVFLNDNGGGGSTDLYAGHSRNYANNKPLRGHKFDVLEGGVRVPMIIRWPKRVPADSVYGEMVSSTDLYPTLVAAADLKMPKGQPTDGVDLLPFINGKTPSKPHEWLCWQNRAWLPRKPGGYGVPTPKVHNSAIRKGDWKLVRLAEKIDAKTPPPAWQLYDLRKDVGEQNDVAKDHAEVVTELSSLFSKWRSSMHPSVE